MQVSLVSTNGLERRLEVTVPGELVASRVDQRLKDLARTARLKGFRPGKVPFAVVRKQFGGQVHSEAVTDLMQKSFAEAVSQERLRPAGDPRIEPLQVAPGEELRYAAVFEVLPEIALKPLDALSVNRPTAAVTEADIDAMIESMRKQKPIFTAVDRAAATTDRVTIAFEGRIDGEVFPGGKGEELHVILGAGTILQELDAALHGMKVGEHKQVPARFPDNYAATAVAGKDAVFDLTVKRIEEQSLPALDEAFVRGFGLAEGGMPEFRTQVRATMEQEVADTAQQRVREQLLELIYKANPLELPRVLVDEQVRDLQVQVLRRMGVQKIEQMPAARALRGGRPQAGRARPDHRGNCARQRHQGGSQPRRAAPARGRGLPSGPGSGAAPVPAEPGGHGAAGDGVPGGSGARLGSVAGQGD